MKTKKHKCGCITEDYKDGIKFVEMCEKHKTNKKFIWIALQHEKTNTTQP